MATFHCWDCHEMIALTSITGERRCPSCGCRHVWTAWAQGYRLAFAKTEEGQVLLRARRPLTAPAPDPKLERETDSN